MLFYHIYYGFWIKILEDCISEDFSSLVSVSFGDSTWSEFVVAPSFVLIPWLVMAIGWALFIFLLYDLDITLSASDFSYFYFIKKIYFEPENKNFTN